MGLALGHETLSCELYVSSPLERGRWLPRGHPLHQAPCNENKDEGKKIPMKLIEEGAWVAEDVITLE